MECVILFWTQSVLESHSSPVLWYLHWMHLEIFIHFFIWSDAMITVGKRMLRLTQVLQIYFADCSSLGFESHVDQISFRNINKFLVPTNTIAEMKYIAEHGSKWRNFRKLTGNVRYESSNGKRICTDYTYLKNLDIFTILIYCISGWLQECNWLLR